MKILITFLVAFMSVSAHSQSYKYDDCQKITDPDAYKTCAREAGKEITRPTDPRDIADRAALKAASEPMVKALMRMDAMVSAGINYPRYTSELGELKLAYANFMRVDRMMRIVPGLVNPVVASINRYEEAAGLWRVKLQWRGTEFAADRDPMIARVIRQYPELAKAYKANSDYLEIDRAVSFLWSTASKDLAVTMSKFDEEFPKQ